MKDTVSVSDERPGCSVFIALIGLFVIIGLCLGVIVLLDRAGLLSL